MVHYWLDQKLKLTTWITKGNETKTTNVELQILFQTMESCLFFVGDWRSQHWGGIKEAQDYNI
jgi:hypothetical protein